MNSKDILIYASISSLLLMSFILFQTHRYIEINAVAITNNSAEIVPIKIEATIGQGNYVNLNSYIDNNFQYSIKMSDEFIKSIGIENIYQYKISFESNSYYSSGSSAGLALTIGKLLLITAPHFDVRNYVFTGVILPFGIIGAVSGIDKKYEAVLKNNKTLIHGNENFKKGLYFNNVFEVYKFITKRDLAKKHKLKIPEWYNKIMREITLELCNKTESIAPNSKEFQKALEAIKKGHYYSAASFCFIANYKYDKNHTKLEIAEEIREIKKKIEKIKNKVLTIYDAEALGMALDRLKDAEQNINNTSYSYWRLQTVKGWLKFVGNTTGIKNYCPNMDLSTYYIYYPFETKINKLTCYYDVEKTLFKVYATVLLTYNVSDKKLLSVLPYYQKHFSLWGYTNLEYYNYTKDKTHLIIALTSFSI
ncbi:NEQ110 [Nanoarchaeum equitans Kin4-M]|uniref:NEQ110 n=1 Tax=Nanoarchaeum equitans (strain Kin4-M) TaxID=228908 RepID=Q74ML1_NANEQ|nr:NEQ110 [Nanoarchaeum equitans Kin4-M]